MRPLESTRNEGFRVIRFLDGLSPAAALLAERSQRSLEGQPVLLPQHHLGEIDQRGLVDRGVQVVGELEGERRIRVAEFRQPHLAVQVLVGVEIARNGPRVGIGGKSELRPLAIDPERVGARRGIRVPEAEPVVKHAENDLQAHAGIIFSRWLSSTSLFSPQGWCQVSRWLFTWEDLSANPLSRFTPSAWRPRLDGARKGFPSMSTA